MFRSGGVVHSTMRGAGPDETIAVLPKADGHYVIQQFVPEAAYTKEDLQNLRTIITNILWYSDHGE